mgnify:CR=1 FL=1
MMEWRFLHPGFLFLLPLPLLWLAWHYMRQAKRTPSVVYSDLSALEAGTHTLKIRMLKLLPLLRTVVIVLGIIALARPQYGRVERRQAAMGIDISIALDVSGSMDRGDFYPTRLEAAKEVLSEFVMERLNDRLSVVIFGTDAFLLVPPTFDRQAVAGFVQDFRESYLSDRQRETAIGNGLAMAVDRLKDSNAESKVAILMTDGENTAGNIEPLQAAEAAEALDIRVYTIGVGTNEEIQEQNIFGMPTGRTARLPFDEELLREIASMTGGKYFHARDKDALASIYEEIDQLETTEIEMSQFDNYDERFMLLWSPALLLLGIEFLLRGFWLVRLP